MVINDIAPWQFVSRKLTRWLLERIEYQYIASNSPCSCCGATSDVWPTPNQAVPFTDGYGRDLLLCEDCITLYQSSAEAMGVERMAKGNPVPNKFGMLSSVLVVADQAGVTMLVPQKIADKLPAGFPVRTYTYATLGDAYRKIYEGDWQYPAVFITDLGKKKGELIRNLRFSYSDKKAFLCSAEAVSVLNLEAMRTCLALAADMEKKDLTLAIKLMYAAPAGRITPAGLAEALKGRHDVKNLILSATTDPAVRLAVAQALKNV